MYNSKDIDKAAFIKQMDSLKQLNKYYKDVTESKEYITGRMILNIKDGIKSKKGRKYLRSCIKMMFHPELINTNEQLIDEKSNYFSDEEFIVYTSIFGRYDSLEEPLFVPDNCKFYIITDQDIPNDSIWEKITVEDKIPNFDKMNDIQKNRFCKMHPHILFPNTRYTIYIDGNVCPVTDLTEFINRCTEYGMALHLHQNRQCVYKEIDVCQIGGKASKEALKEFKGFLEENHFPHNYGLLECNVIVRDNNNLVCRNIMEEWWQLFEQMNAKRDQLSFVYVLFKHNIKPFEVATLGNNVYKNNAIRIIAHREKNV